MHSLHVLEKVSKNVDTLASLPSSSVQWTISPIPLPQWNVTQTCWLASLRNATNLVKRLLQLWLKHPTDQLKSVFKRRTTVWTRAAESSTSWNVSWNLQPASAADSRNVPSPAFRRLCSAPAHTSWTQRFWLNVTLTSQNVLSNLVKNQMLILSHQWLRNSTTLSLKSNHSMTASKRRKNVWVQPLVFRNSNVWSTWLSVWVEKQQSVLTGASHQPYSVWWTPLWVDISPTSPSATTISWSVRLTVLEEKNWECLQLLMIWRCHQKTTLKMESLKSSKNARKITTSAFRKPVTTSNVSSLWESVLERSLLVAQPLACHQWQCVWSMLTPTHWRLHSA